MFENSKVIWSEGIFLLPQHFQQHDRYIQNLVNSRCLGLRPYDWGFYSLTIDSDLFKIGKLALKECKGIFPDGTPFNLPEDDELPLPLDIPEDIHGKSLIPVLRNGDDEPLRDAAIFGRLNMSHNVTDGEYVLYHFARPRSEEEIKPALFHLPSDPDEENDLASSHPEALERMRKLMLDKMEEIDAPKKVKDRLGLSR